MSLQRVVYTDGEGRKRYVLLPEDVPEEEADKGIPVGPPPLESLNLPVETEVRLNNELFARGIILPADALRKRAEVYSAIQAAFKVDATRVVDLYVGRDYRNARQESAENLTNSTVHYRRPRKPRQ